MSKTKVKITLANGAQVIIEGAPQEVADIMGKLGFSSVKDSRKNREQASASKKSPRDRKIKTSPTDLILSLADGGFFKTPKDLASIKEGLAEIGHIYPVQTLSSIVFKMVRRRYLRRIKQGGRWVYIR